MAEVGSTGAGARFSLAETECPVANHSPCATPRAKMSGILRAAVPLARRLNAVPKGPMNATQATRSYAGARPARAPRASRGYF